MDLLSNWRSNEKAKAMEALEHLRDFRHRVHHSIRYAVHGLPPMSAVTFEDLKVLSGYKQRAKIIEWLRKNKIPFVLNNENNPVTTTDILERAIGDKSGKTRS